MVDLIERIGPALGIVAFLGLAVLAFLIFQQAREVRRLREWAGRAPERAEEAADASLAAAEARGEEVEVPAGERGERGERFAALSAWRERVGERLAPAWRAVDRRSPIDPRYFVVLLAAVFVAAAVLTSGFGIGGGEDGDGSRRSGSGAEGEREQRDASKPVVAVLNATQTEDATGVEIQGVPGLADKVANQVVRRADYPVGKRTNAADGFAETVVMFEPDVQKQARALAADVEARLGPTETQAMIQDVRQLVGGAKLAVIIGADDAQF